MRPRIARFSAMTALVLVLSAASLGGCSAVIAIKGIEPTDLSAISDGASREAVEAVLGEPVRTVATEFGRIDTYEYDRGRRPGEPEDLGVLRCTDCEDAELGVAAFYLLTQPYWINDIYADQKGELEVYYGADDTVVYTVIGEAEDVANAGVIRSAACGEPDSQFDIGWGYESGFSAIHHEPTAKQPAEAYFWYTLAAGKGHAEAREGVRRLKAELVAGEAGRAEQRAALWEPLTDCDWLWVKGPPRRGVDHGRAAKERRSFWLL